METKHIIKIGNKVNIPHLKEHQDAFKEMCDKYGIEETTISEKLFDLFMSESISYVNQAFELLVTYGDSALTLLVHEQNGALELQPKYQRNRIEIETRILRKVQNRDSSWYDCFQQGLFNGMIFRTSQETDWSQLPSETQTLFLEESLKMIPITAGIFTMGAVNPDSEAKDFEKPRHKVRLTRDFLMSQYTVTQGLWKHIMGNNHCSHINDFNPVHETTWFQCIFFCNQLSLHYDLEPVYKIPDEVDKCLSEYQRLETNWSEETEDRYYQLQDRLLSLSAKVKTNFDSNGYRLPTEAEWEYVAREQGSSEYIYPGTDDISMIAHFDQPLRGGQTSAVGQFMPTVLGLYDMSGNVYEWVTDGKRIYPYNEFKKWSTRDLGSLLERLDISVPRLKKDRLSTLLDFQKREGYVVDPLGPFNENRGLRGGSWWLGSSYARASFRGANPPSTKRDDSGIRLVRSLVVEEEKMA